MSPEEHYYPKEFSTWNIKANVFNSNISIIPINLEFNKTTYNIDNNYILKICLKPKKEKYYFEKVKSYLNNFLLGFYFKYVKIIRRKGEKYYEKNKRVIKLDN